MTYSSVFDFLKEDSKFKQIYEECLAFENNILNKYESVTLRTGRVICQLLIEKIAKTNSDLRKEFFGLDENGNEKRCFLYQVIIACHNKGLIDKKTRQLYFEVKNYGDPNSHGRNYGQYNISDCKKVHKILFNLSKNCFKLFHEDDLKFEYIDNLEYNYNLDDVEPVQFTLKQRNEIVNKLHEDEIKKSNLENYLKLNKLYLDKNSINSIINKYTNFLNDEDKFIEFLEKNDFITDDNLSKFLSYFELSEKFNIINDLKNKNSQILYNILPYLNDFPEEFNIEFISELINDSGDNNIKSKYELIKELSYNFLEDDLKVITTELSNNPIIEIDAHGREIETCKKYDVVKDDYGLKITEVENNIFLDEDQEEAVYYKKGENEEKEKPLVINAGPGSGKTRVLIERVKFLIKNGAEPHKILLITFTNEATNELRNRLKYETDLGINVVNRITISTVHSFCRNLISDNEMFMYNYLERNGEKGLFFNEHKEELGFTGYAEIPDYEFSTNIERKYDYYFNFGLYEEDFANYIKANVYSKRKIKPEFKKYVDDFKRLNGGRFPTFNQIKEAGLINSYYYAKFIEIVDSYPKYKKLLEDNKYCDDNYLLDKAYNFLCTHNTDFKYILIDEFQDTDFHLKRIFDKLQENALSFTMVGDSDQSIYGWRGALPCYFDKIIAPENRKNIKYVELHTNYRSTSNIVDFNEEFIRKKRDVEKNLRAKKQYKTPIYHLRGNEENEFKNIIYIIKSLVDDHVVKKYSDIAVLFRTNYRAESFIEDLKIEQIPFYLKGNKDLLERDEIKSILTLFWYLIPYNKYELVYRGDDFLNLSAFGSDFSNDFFKLSENTGNLFKEIQSNFEDKVITIAKEHYRNPNNYVRNLKYKDVFNFDFEFIKGVIDEVYQINISDLNEMELSQLGIDNAQDLEFFTKLNNLKYRMFNGDADEKPTTLDIFNELIHLNNYIGEISIRGTLDAKKTEKNLATVSRIINDYENIKSKKDYIGLFNYLNGVLRAYSSYIDETENYDDEVHVMTVHKSKGLEYPVVIVASLNDGEFPKKYKNDYPFPTDLEFLEHKPNDLDSEKKLHFQEEMRMIYVATTRAKEVLILSTKSDDVEFLNRLKRNSDIKIQKLNFKNAHMIPKVESSKVKSTNSIPELFIEEILRNYLICPYRYYICNDVKFAVNVSDDYHLEMVLHNLLNNIHSQKNLSKDEVIKKINPILNYHHLSSNERDFDIISNVSQYWEEYGSNYDVVETDFTVFKELNNCNLFGTIDLIINDGDGLSIVQFVGSEDNIDNIRLYELLLHFYALALRRAPGFENKKLNRIILHSIENNSIVIDVNIKDIYEKYGLRELNKITTNILNKKFEKKDNCEICQYSKFCKGR